jgi:type II secretory pathway predicted ATPase ExeA
MPTLAEPATRDYLLDRLRIAGAPPDLLEPAAMTAIHKVARGTHRLIDRVTTDSMTLAALDGRPRVTEEDVYNASQTI